MNLKSWWLGGGLLSKAPAMFIRFACSYLGTRDLKKNKKTKNWIRRHVKKKK